MGRVDDTMDRQGEVGSRFACRTRLSRVLGEGGRLTCGGYEIADLAANATFEEVCHLLWHGSLPAAGRAAELAAQLRANMQPDPGLLELVRRVPPATHPMAALRTAIAFVGDAGDATADAGAGFRQAVRLTAQAVTISAAIGRIRAGTPIVAPHAGLGLAANLLYMLHGIEPDAEQARALDVAMILHAEHGMNASTFAARLAASTRADMRTAVVAAMAVLQGSRHGGANEGVMRMLLDIGSPERAEPRVREMLDRGERVPGFGHLEYRTADPRVPILEALSRSLLARTADARWVDVASRVRDVMAIEMAERRKRVCPNVDLFSATLYRALDIPAELFPTIFTCARMAGWTAHILEQYQDDRFWWPGADYTGPDNLRVEPAAHRP